MTITDKHNILRKIGTNRRVCIELGCGNRKQDTGFIGVDAIDSPCVDIVGDVFEVLSNIPDTCVDEIHSRHFMEHVEDLGKLMREIARVLRENGKLFVTVPHFSNAYFYSDYTHKQPFGLYSFSYFAKDTLLTRKVPVYEGEPAFSLKHARLIFKSPRPFYVRFCFRKCLEYLVNIHPFLMEFYEENLTGILSCYEIDFELEKIGEYRK